MTISSDEFDFDAADVEIRFDVLEGGTIEVSARLSPHGGEVIERLAASCGLSPFDLLGRIIHRSLINGASHR